MKDISKIKKVLDPKDTKIFRTTQIHDKLMNELVGLSFGIIADGKVDLKEAKTLHKWLISNKVIVQNPILNILLEKVEGYLEDNILDSNEALELFGILQKFAGADFEIGELRKSTRLPIDNSSSAPIFKDKNFCFTGTFAFGSRRECEQVTTTNGAICQQRPNKWTDYLVIGLYVSDAWISTSWGRKIEKALDLREKGSSIKIIGEEHWIDAIKKSDNRDS